MDSWSRTHNILENTQYTYMLRALYVFRYASVWLKHPHNKMACIRKPHYMLIHIHIPHTILEYIHAGLLHDGVGIARFGSNCFFLFLSSPSREEPSIDLILLRVCRFFWK